MFIIVMTSDNPYSKDDSMGYVEDVESISNESIKTIRIKAPVHFLLICIILFVVKGISMYSIIIITVIILFDQFFKIPDNLKRLCHIPALKF